MGKFPEDPELLVDIRNRYPSLFPPHEEYPALVPIDTNIHLSILDFREKGFSTISTIGPFVPANISLLAVEVSQLLERAAALRNLKQELEARALEFALDDKYWSDIEALEQEEVSAGIDILELKIAEQRKLKSEEAHSKGQAAYQHLSAALGIRDPSDQLATKRIEESANVTAAMSPGSVTTTVKEWARSLERVRLEYESSDLLPTLDMQAAQINEASSEHAISDLLVQFETANIGFKKARRAARLNREHARRHLAKQQGGALNYSDRMMEAYNIFLCDFASAIARADAITVALKDRFDIDMPRPGLGANGSLGELTLWIRSVVLLLAYIGQNEQEVTWAVDLESIMGQSAWSSGLDTGHFDFTLGEENFPECRNVRLRSVGVFAEYFSPHLQWTAVLKLPSIGHVRYAKIAGIPSMDRDEAQVDQSYLPTLLFSDVGPRGVDQVSYLKSGGALPDASPEGKYTLTILPGNGPAALGDSLSRIELVLRFVALPKANK
jgi:hypothetical protein